MSLTDINNVAFSTTNNIDKIVDVKEGSFTSGTDTTAVGGSLERYDISHSFTRPLFTELLWSTDGSTWIDGGAGASSGNGKLAISYSDDSEYHILTNQTSGTIYYKIIATWITDYDTTNPSVNSFAAPSSDVFFDSRVNYQKIDQEGVFTFTGSGFDTLTHNLASPPYFKGYIEAFEGEVYPLVGGASVLYYDATEQATGTLYINGAFLFCAITVPGGASQQTRRVWYKIYEDLF